MPIDIPTSLTEGDSGTDTDIYTTASVTPSANKLVLIAISATVSGAVPTPTISGNGLTWIQVGADVDYDAAGQQGSSFLFRAMGAAPSVGVITIDFGTTMLGCLWSVVEIGNVDTSGADGAGAVGTVDQITSAGDVTDLAVTISPAPAVENGVYAAMGQDDVSDMTPETGYTKLHEQHLAAELDSIMTFYRTDADDTPGTTWATASQAGIIAIEVIVAPSAPLGTPVGAQLQTVIVSR